MVVYDEVPKTVSYQINIGKVYKIYAFVFLYFQILQITSIRLTLYDHTNPYMYTEQIFNQLINE